MKSIGIQEKLDLTNYEDDTTAIYKLKGIIIHEGQYAASGHFAAVVKQESEWWLYSDEQVRHLEDQYLLSQTILQNIIMAFYELE